MTIEEIEILKSEKVRDAIDQNIERDSAAIALDKSVPYSSVVATQVKYLQRAKRKLPEYYQVRAIIPSLAFEQSSSEATSKSKNYSGKTCIDLTCGLGVDSLRFSRSFEHVVSVERDNVLAAVAKENFKRLGVHNIEIMNLAAEDFVNAAVQEGRRVDMIYIDPDRRGAKGQKLVRLEDCSPDVIALMPRLKQISDCIVIKVSPMFDVSEAFRLFGRGCAVEVVSVSGECKEVLVEISDTIQMPLLRATAVGMGMFVRGSEHMPLVSDTVFEPPYRYLFMPDVSLRKSRLTAAYCGEYLFGMYLEKPEGYVFIKQEPPHCLHMGRLFEIDFMEEYAPKRQRKRLADMDVHRAEIYMNGFRFDMASVLRSLGLREGGDKKIALTETSGKLWYIELKEISL